MKKALITGITGQDGSYLAEFLLNKGYEVHGIIRRASTFNTSRIDHIFVDPHETNVRLLLHYGDLSNSEQISNTMYNIQPDEIYHLGAQSHVRVSFDMPEYTGDIIALGTTRLLEAIRRSGIKTKFYQASSSEMFGSSAPPQNESTPFHPRSPYAAAKVYAFWMAVNYREGLVNWLEGRGVETRPIMAGNIEEQPAMRLFDCRKIGDLPNSKFIMHNSFFFGNHHGITKAEKEAVISYVKEFIRDAVER